MRSGRLELPHPKIRVPKTRASTNSATTAQINFSLARYILKIIFTEAPQFDTKLKLQSF